MKRSVTRRLLAKGRRSLRGATDRLESRRKVPWPVATSPSPGDVVVVTVNYNTVELVRQLLYSLYRFVPAARIGGVVVVDNGSDDGSQAYLQVLADRELITLISNPWPPYHGPALNRAFSHLAASPDADRIERVWVLDSDTVVLREDALTRALETSRSSDAAIVGQLAPASARQSSDHVLLCSALVDPSRVWAAGMPVFEEHGLPSSAIQAATLARGWSIEDFPYCDGEYVLHLGGATIASVVRDGKRSNAYFAWAKDNDFGEPSTFEYSFQGVEHGAALYRQFLDEYEPVAAALDPVRFAGLLDDLRAASDVG